MMGQKAAGPVMALVVTMSLLGGSLAQANQTRSLEAFSNIYACVPFTATVDPGDGYSVSISAEQAVTDAILTTVKDGNLYLESGSFDSSQPIEVSISLPASELKSVNHYGQLSGLFVSPGFSSSSLSMTTGFGAGRLYVLGAKADTVDIRNSGSGDVVLDGDVGSVSLATTGITRTYIAGVSGTVTLYLSGISNVYVDPASSGASITGSASGISSVQYSAGTCAVSSGFALTQTCQAVPATVFQIAEPSWSQGLHVSGNFTCAAVAGLEIPALSAAASWITGSMFNSGLGSPIQLPPLVPQPTVATPVPSSAAPVVPLPSPSSSAATQSSAVASDGAAAAPTPEQEGSTDLNAPNPFQYSEENESGSQQGSGSVSPGSSQASSAAQGTNSASSVSVAGPESSYVQTSNDGITNTRATGGRR